MENQQPSSATPPTPAGSQVAAGPAPAIPSYENPLPAAQQIAPAPNTSVKYPSKSQHSGLWAGAIIVICILFLSVGYAIWHHSQTSGTIMSPQQAKPAMATLSIPKGATIISQCETGHGTQYVLPKDVPMGPIYNVYQGKVIGLEYMIPQTDISQVGKVMSDLPLMHAGYDHLEVQLMQAHAGMPEPHLQVDVMLVAKSVENGISCGTSAPTGSGMSTM